MILLGPAIPFSDSRGMRRGFSRQCPWCTDKLRVLENSNKLAPLGCRGRISNPKRSFILSDLWSLRISDKIDIPSPALTLNFINMTIPCFAWFSYHARSWHSGSQGIVVPVCGRALAGGPSAELAAGSHRLFPAARGARSGVLPAPRVLVYRVVFMSGAYSPAVEVFGLCLCAGRQAVEVATAVRAGLCGTCRGPGAGGAPFPARFPSSVRPSPRTAFVTW